MDIWVLILPLVRVSLYIGMMLVNGSILYGLLLGNQMTAGSQAHLSGLVRTGALIGLAAVAVQLPVSAGYLGGDVASAFDPLYLRLMLETTLGWSSLLAAAGFIIAVWRPGLDKTYHRPAGGLICLLIASAFAVHGHAATGGLVTSLLLIVHLACVAVWLGAFLPLLRLCRLAADNPAALRELAQTGRQFAQVGSIAVALLLASGGALAALLTGSVTAMVTTGYGLALSGKVLLVSGVLGLAALNRFLLVPAVDRGEREAAARLGLSVRLEMLAALAIMLVTSLLTTSLALPMSP